MLTEWVANLVLGEEEEVMLLVPQAEREAFVRELEAEEDPLRRQAKDEEKRLEWKLRLVRERRWRLEAVHRMERELRAVEERMGQLRAEADLHRKIELLSHIMDVILKVQQEQLRYLRGQDIALQSMRMGFKNSAREIMMHVGAEVRAALENTERFCTGIIEGAKIATPKEEEARPRQERVKVKFPESYSGKKAEDFDNWEANIKSYLHLQDITPENHVLVAFYALKEEAASFARSIARAAKCDNDMVTYSSITNLSDFLSALRERFTDVTRGLKASDKLQTIHMRQWSAGALKATMD
ncbi:hypothetical protein CBR_g53535 [Chara braunii]|uniref:Uncharacterized protein n=1 Tax=Chara braunii TaxID=69332 RepID=A0A388MAW4_CHABU|nr:hypothetical protein CBR_g53535 [Chara braunii]|eukprot:GBG91721.1 hypothetical protein CBR_g53535 [Chara braunii]